VSCGHRSTAGAPRALTPPDLQEARALLEEWEDCRGKGKREIEGRDSKERAIPRR